MQIGKGIRLPYAFIPVLKRLIGVLTQLQPKVEAVTEAAEEDDDDEDGF